MASTGRGRPQGGGAGQYRAPLVAIPLPYLAQRRAWNLYVNLPLNWRIRDFQRLPEKRRFPLQMQRPMSKEALANPNNGSNFPTDWSESEIFASKIDRCPVESMAPVRRLHDLARPLAGKRWEDLEGE